MGGIERLDTEEAMLHFKKAHVKSALRGCFAALAVFLLGFGALNVFWHFDSYGNDLPGLYDYLAATWGDGLFLPLGAGALVYCLSDAQRPDGKAFRVVPVACAVIGLMVGLLIQGSWLADGGIALNWTIPEPHMFNAAGWYHAAFFSVAIAFYSYCLSACCCRYICVNACGRMPVRACELLIALSAAGYFEMHALDDYSSFAPQPWLAVAVAVIVLFALLLLKALAVCVNACGFRCPDVSGSLAVSAADAARALLDSLLSYSSTMLFAVGFALMVSSSFSPFLLDPVGFVALGCIFCKRKNNRV